MPDPDVVLEQDDRLTAWANRLIDMARRKSGKVHVRKEGVDFYVDPEDRPQEIVEKFNLQREISTSSPKPRRSKK